jgi:glycosyltransferase involved in cell wall biosynthesis
LYGKIKSVPTFKHLTNGAIKRFFDVTNYDNCDIIHFIQYVPSKIPEKPYVIDFEHVVGLTNFADTWDVSELKIKEFLTSKYCVGILPMSKAALRTFKDKFGEEFYLTVHEKIDIVYPALNTRVNLAVEDKSIMKDSKKFNILFVGNDVYRKGLHILLEAFVRLPENEYNLYVVSDIPKELKNKYSGKNIYYLSPNFSREDIIRRLLSLLTFFVMPTLFDTFGMVFLDALLTETQVLATRLFAIPEISRAWKSAYLLK